MRLVPGWHPAIVHFPLALVITASCFLGAARVLRASRAAETSAIVGTWTLVVGALGLLFALGTGLAAVVDLNLGAAAHESVSAHVKSAILTTVLVLSAAVWRGAGVAQEARPSWGFILLMLLAASSSIVTGYRGGQNVYRHGVGVSADAEQAAETKAPQSPLRDPAAR